MSNIVSVTALNLYVKSLLEANEVLTDISIKGEISNFINHQKTGHFYFSLKDEKCSVKAVMFKWSNQSISFLPQTGMNVVVSGKISLYERDGSFQIYVDKMFPDGAGSIQMAFEKLKEKLSKEGLFDDEHKKPIPKSPETIGVVTSKTGAALQDIVNVISRRYPLVRLLFSPATVQGENAYKEIVNAIKTLDNSGKCDAIIVARGGGSAEDLWVFNHEKIARAVFACKAPIISGIGHEIDFTILDFVADMRAPTPSAAAEIAVPDIQNMYRKCKDLCNNIQKSIYINYDICYNNIVDAKSSKGFDIAVQIPQKLSAKLENIKDKLVLSVTNNYNQTKTDFENKVQVLSVLNPYSILKRGYTVTSVEGKPISQDNMPYLGDNITIKGDRFCVNAQVTKTEIEN